MAWLCCRRPTDGTCVNRSNNVQTTICTGCGHQCCDACEVVIDSVKDEESEISHILREDFVNVCCQHIWCVDDDFISETEFSEDAKDSIPDIEGCEDKECFIYEVESLGDGVDELPEVDYEVDENVQYV